MKTIFRPTFDVVFKSIFEQREFSPADLFAAGGNGVWFDPSDTETLFEDAAGSLPVTLAGQPVGLALDKSRNLFFGSELLANGDFSSGLTGWGDASGGLAFSSVIDGQAHVNNAAGDGLAGIGKSFATVPGKLYKLSVDVISSTNGWRAGVGIGLNNLSLVDSGQKTALGTYTAFFVATGTSSAVNIYTFPNAVTTADRTTVFDNVSVLEFQGLYASQAVSGDRPLFTSDAALENVSSDSLNWNAAAGTYTIAYAGSSGVIILDGQALSGSTNILLATKIFSYVAINRTLGSIEKNNILSYLDKILT